jgi:hypothetical protein
MFIGAKWFCFIDPIFYAFRAIIPQQFVCSADSPAFCGAITASIPGSGLTKPMPPCACCRDAPTPQFFPFGLPPSPPRLPPAFASHRHVRVYSLRGERWRHVE